MSRRRKSKSWSKRVISRRVRRTLNAMLDFYKFLGGGKGSSRGYGSGITSKGTRERY